ncbi:hypothetical protein GF374_00820 [Candidatus Woesearchaeota archaeon]|nr:hypothetical protein [Candidatus Woesearchaeota archaeon]
MVKKISTTLSEEFHLLASSFGIKWSEALRIGISILLMERGEYQFANPLNRNRIMSLAKKVGLTVV